MVDAEAKRSPVVTAEEVQARLAAIKQERAGAYAPPPMSEPERPVTDFQRRCRARVVLLDYFDATALRNPSAGPAKTVARRPRSLSDRIRSLLVRAYGQTRVAPESASPLDPVESQALDDFAAQDCDLVATGHGTGWRLRLPVRHETLRELGVDGALNELARADAIPAGEDDVTHRMARRLLEGDRELHGLSATELSGILRALEWLAPLGLDLPTEPDVRAALDLANVLAPLRAVAGPDFVGRERELGLLEDFLTEAAPGGTRARALAIHGPGGIGKSTLLARFVLDHVGQDANRRREEPLLFSYLSFDRGELDPQFPLTLLGEAARQISLQAPELIAPLARVRQQIDEVLAAQMALRNEATTIRGSSKRDAHRHLSDAAIVADVFAEAVGSVVGDTPLLLVLDTFEMAQRRSRSFLGQLDAALHRMHERLRSLRVVVAGRAPVEELTVRNVPLEGLDETLSEALLTKALNGRKVDPALIRLIVEQVSGNPLSLRLAADLVIREGSQAISQGRGRRRLLYDLRAEQVQGVLYRRILDHVDKQVRPLANPGLVVRQITPDVIQQVLAEPTGMGMVSPLRAQLLFELLGREVALVTEARPGVLVHRADVRREMLPLLAAEDADRVRDIHERAIAYYQKRTGIDDQIEHLYHRLMLGQSSEVLDANWNRTAATFLEDAWDELPPEARVYLAGRLGVEASAADLAAADRTAWIRQATSQARALLDAGQPGQALEILDGRTLVPRDLSVTRLVVEALASQGHDTAALSEARAAIAEADERGLPLEYLQLNLLAGRIAEDWASAAGDPTGLVEAARLYLEARQSAVDFGARAEALTAGVGVLRVARRAARPLGDLRLDELRHQLLADVATLTDRVKATHPALLRELAAELGDELPTLLVDAARHIGVETEGRTARQLPQSSQEALQRAATRDLPPAPAPTPPPWTSSHEQPPVTSSEVGQNVADALSTSPEDDHLKESLKDYWQSEADRPSFDYDAEGKG